MELKFENHGRRWIVVPHALSLRSVLCINKRRFIGRITFDAGPAIPIDILRRRVRRGYPRISTSINLFLHLFDFPARRPDRRVVRTNVATRRYLRPENTRTTDGPVHRA